MASGPTVLGLGRVVGGPVWAGERVMWVQRGPSGHDRLMLGAPGEPARSVHLFDDGVASPEYLLSASATHVAVVRSVSGVDLLGETLKLQADIYAGPIGGPLALRPGCRVADFDSGPYAAVSGAVLAIGGCRPDLDALTLTNLATGVATVRHPHDLGEVRAAGPYVAYGNSDEAAPNQRSGRITVLNAETGEAVYSVAEGEEGDFLVLGFQLQPSGAVVVERSIEYLCAHSAVASPARPHLLALPGVCDLLGDGGAVDGDRILLEHPFPSPAFEWVADFSGHAQVLPLPAHEGTGSPGRLAIHGERIAYAGLACWDDPLIVASLDALPADGPRPRCIPDLLDRPRITGTELWLRLACPKGCDTRLYSVTLRRRARALRSRLTNVPGSSVLAPTGRHRRLVLHLKPAQRRAACRDQLTVGIRASDRFDHQGIVRYQDHRRVRLRTPDC